MKINLTSIELLIVFFFFIFEHTCKFNVWLWNFITIPFFYLSMRDAIAFKYNNIL